MVFYALSNRIQDCAVYLGSVRFERNQEFQVGKVDRGVVRNGIRSFEHNLRKKAILHLQYVLIVVNPSRQPNSTFTHLTLDRP
jgi:hypothetical protein